MDRKAKEEEYTLKFGVCRLDRGYSEDGDVYEYLVVMSDSKINDHDKVYLLDSELEIVRVICGITRAYGKSRNDRCRRPAGAGTSHSGIGHCSRHIKHPTAAVKFRREKLLTEFKEATGSPELLVNALHAVDAWPRDSILNLEYDITIVTGIIQSMLEGLIKRDKQHLLLALRSGNDEVIQEMIGGMVGLDKDLHLSLQGWFRIKDSLIRSKHTIESDNSYSGEELAIWLDEVKQALITSKGTEFAEEVVSIIAATKGLADPRLGKDKAKVRKLHGIGYSNIVDTEYTEVLQEGDEGALLGDEYHEEKSEEKRFKI